MEKVREMNPLIFYNNLIMTIYEIMDTKNVEEDKVRFKILPVYEKDKSFNGRDNLMRLVVLSEKNVGDRLFTIKEIVKLVTCMEPLVPIWINVSLDGVDGENIIFNFETSLRLRKPSLLKNAETGHPPFKAIVFK